MDVRHVCSQETVFKALFYDIQQWITEERNMFPPKADPETCALRINICNIWTQSATQTELVALVNF